MAKEILHVPPELYGLVLVGGHSRRFGVDKSQLQWRGQTLSNRCLHLIRPHCQRTFISCRSDQAAAFDHTDVIVDNYGHSGPMGGILSAMASFPKVAFLVLAVDLIGIDDTMLAQLVRARSVQYNGTCFQPEGMCLQPLCAIYEPGAKRPLMQQWRRRDYALHKVIEAQNFHIIPAPSEKFTNVNYPQDWEFLSGEDHRH